MSTWHVNRTDEPPEPEVRPDVAAGTIVIYSDLSCAFAHSCVHRLMLARDRASADVRFVHRPFLLEEVNDPPPSCSAHRREQVTQRLVASEIADLLG